MRGAPASAGTNARHAAWAASAAAVAGASPVPGGFSSGTPGVSLRGQYNSGRAPCYRVQGVGSLHGTRVRRRTFGLPALGALRISGYLVVVMALLAAAGPSAFMGLGAPPGIGSDGESPESFAAPDPA